jgi:hypothetical protein
MDSPLDGMAIESAMSTLYTGILLDSPLNGTIIEGDL